MNEYRWELYEYTLNYKKSITSWDIYSNQYDIGMNEHYYYNVNKNNNIELPFYGYGTYRNMKTHNTFYESAFIIDTFDSFHLNYKTYIDKLTFNEDVTNSFIKIIFKYISCYELSIFKKNETEIFIIYMGISKNEFLEFLIDNDYPKNIIYFIQSNEYNITNEIAIVYDIKTKNIIRTAIYGNI